MSDFMAYTHNIIRIAEEHGGVRTAYQYDVLQRKAMAKALERDETDLAPLFTVIDRDVLKSSMPREGTNGGRKGQGRVNGQKGKEDERLREIWCLLWRCFVRGEHIVLALRTVCDEEGQELRR